MTDRIGRDTMLMEMARIVSRRSTCSRSQVGAVISDRGRVISLGYNGAPTGMEHCDHTCPCTAGYQRAPEHGESPFHTTGCPLRPCTTAIHAEANAIADAAAEGRAVRGATMHVTMWPCLPCAQLIVAAGIHLVTYDQPYRDNAGLLYIDQSFGTRMRQFAAGKDAAMMAERELKRQREKEQR